MTYIVTIQEAFIALNVESECEVKLYYTNKGVKKVLDMGGELDSKEVLMVNEGKTKQEIEISHQTLILDVVLLRNLEGKSKPEKKKAGHVVIHLDSYEENKVIQLELEMRDCIVKDASVQLKFSYRKIVDLFDLPPPTKSPSERNQNGEREEVQRPKSSGEFKVLAQKVIQLEQRVEKQDQTIKRLEQQLEEEKFDHQEEINKTKRVEEMYRKEKESFDETTTSLKQQLITAKNQLTEIMDVLNERGEASILETIQELISR